MAAKIVFWPAARQFLRILGASLLILAACGDDGGASSGGEGGSGSGAGGGSSTSDGVTLTVRGVETSSEAIAGTSPDAGDVFTVVDLTLTNGSDDSLPLAGISFAVKDAAGIERSGHPLTEVIAGGCEADASVSPDGEASCTVVFSTPEDADLESLVYTWEEGRVEADLIATGAGGGGSGECAELASGAHVLALSVQLRNDRPLFFDAAVAPSGDGLSIELTPLRTPYRDVGTPMVPVGTPISLTTGPVGLDGSFTLETGTVSVTGEANPFSPGDITASMTLVGTACPGGAGSFCGTLSGQITAPVSLVLEGSRNFFAFNEPGADLTYDCTGNVAGAP
jgi:hypothetical protein